LEKIMEPIDEAAFLKAAQKKIPRMLMHGVHYSDLMTAIDKARDDERWFTEWCSMALLHQKLAETALAEGKRVTAGEAFLRASIYYHYAQLYYFNDLGGKLLAIDRKADCFNRAAPFLDTPAKRVVFPFETIELPGYLRVPSKEGKHPCVIILGGVDSTKEENHFITEDYLKRGMGTLCIDGPGQGEVWRRMKMREDFEKCISAVLDNLYRLEAVDAGRIGILGRSMGGHYACRSAASDRRIKAAISNGGSYDMSSWPQRSHEAKLAFMFFSGAKNLEEAEAKAKIITLDGLSDKIRCPLLLVHGGRDAVVPHTHAERIAREVRGEKTLIIYPDAGHGLHSVSYMYRPVMADWMKEHLCVAANLPAEDRRTG
jgi:2,6-dihydroxypseudooxynicotine hydrolase